jgi:hypothetical protein
MTGVLGVGLSSSGDNTAIVPPEPVPGGGGGVEPAPVGPPPGAFIKPSTPQLIGAVQGINVLWDGLNVDGELWPYDTSYIEVHSSTAGTGFTLGTATLQGRLARPGGLYVGGLTAGSTYHFRFRGADPAGNFTEASDAASGQTGLTTVSDYGVGSIGTGAVSFDARAIGGITTTVGTATPSSPQEGDVWLDTSGGNTTHKRYTGGVFVTQAWASASIGANVITATQMAAGAITAGAIAAGAITADKINAGAVTTDKLTAGTITGFVVSGGTVTGGFITGGTIESAAIQTSGGSSRIRIKDAVTVPFGSSDAIEFFGGGASKALVAYNNALSAFIVYSNDIAFIDYNNAGTARVEVNGSFDVIGTAEAQSFRPTGSVIVFQGYRTTVTAGDVIMRLQSNVTNTGEAKFEVEADGDVKSRTNSYAGFSDARYKDNIIPARDYLEDLRQVEVVTFNWQNSDQKLLGVTAQQLQPIFPNMVAEDEDGTLSVRYSVFVPMLLTAVQSLADKVDDLTARIEALEA